MEDAIVDFCEINGKLNKMMERTFSPRALANALQKATEPDMDKYACSLAIDTMLGYYRVRIPQGGSSSCWLTHDHR